MIGKLISGIKSAFSAGSWSDSDSEDSNMDGTTDNLVNGLSIRVKKNVYQIPVEVMCLILKWVDEDTLVFSCRLVCKEWNDIVDNLVWDEKADCTKHLLGPRSEIQIPWWVSYWIVKKDVFKRNLITNNCGQDNLKYWNILDNGGDSWIVEKNPVGTIGLLPRCEEIGTNTSCFVSSFSWCSKEQVIKLSKVGLSDKIMDEIKPDFEFSDWIATRFDCGGVHGMHVVLLDKKGEPLSRSHVDRNLMCNKIRYNRNYHFGHDEFDSDSSSDEDNINIESSEMFAEKRLEAGDGWCKVSGVLKGPYPPGARYISFYHKGQDTQFWKGHYGVKITGSLLRPVFPKDYFLANIPPPTPTD